MAVADDNTPVYRNRPSGRVGDQRVDAERAWHDWMMVGVGITGLLSILAIIVSFVALGSTSTAAAGVANTAAVSAGSGNAAGAAALAAPVVKSESLKVIVKTDTEHGRLGPDGKWHDAFVPADFTVHAGDKVTVTVENYDSSPHSFTSPSMGVNEIIAGGGTPSAPHESTFTFTAPKKAGAYQWWCSVPCDPWAMKHNGYMRGIVTVA
jgi:plastocyanin